LLIQTKGIIERRRMLAFLALSLLLHGLFVFLALGNRRLPHAVAEATSLDVQMPRAVHPSAIPMVHERNEVAHAGSASPSIFAHRQAPEAGDQPVETVGTSESRHSTVDLNAVFASARSLGREAKGSRVPGRPATPGTTVESAIAKAFGSGDIVETRGADGEWVYQTGDLRCVSPVRVPVFMQGVTLMPLCR
jgi:hypothetical protein